MQSLSIFLCHKNSPNIFQGKCILHVYNTNLVHVTLRYILNGYIVKPKKMYRTSNNSFYNLHHCYLLSHFSSNFQRILCQMVLLQENIKNFHNDNLRLWDDEHKIGSFRSFRIGLNTLETKFNTSKLYENGHKILPSFPSSLKSLFLEIRNI